MLALRLGESAKVQGSVVGLGGWLAELRVRRCWEGVWRQRHAVMNVVASVDRVRQRIMF